jgi:hypothetical protein
LQLINKSKELSDKEKEYLGIVLKKVGFLRELSDDFLDVSLVEKVLIPSLISSEMFI